MKIRESKDNLNFRILCGIGPWRSDAEGATSPHHGPTYMRGWRETCGSNPEA